MPGLRQRVARGFVLRVSRDLRCDATGLSRARIRMVRDSGSVLAREVRRARRRQSDGRRCSCSIRPSARIFRSARRRRISLTGAGCSTRIRTTARRSCAPTRSSLTGPISHPDTSMRCLTPTTPSADYLRRHADRDFVMILLGDHQPAAAVSGKGASWGVPVHVIASRPRMLDRLVARGFRHGLMPARPSLAHMNALLPILLDCVRQPTRALRLPRTVRTLRPQRFARES